MNKSAKQEKLGKYWSYCTRNQCLLNCSFFKVDLHLTLKELINVNNNTANISVNELLTSKIKWAEICCKMYYRCTTNSGMSETWKNSPMTIIINYNNDNNNKTKYSIYRWNQHMLQNTLCINFVVNLHNLHEQFGCHFLIFCLKEFRLSQF